MKVRIYAGEEAIRQIRGPWEELQHHPNTDLEHYLLVCKLREQVISPWAFSVWEGNACKTIVVGRIEKKFLRPKIGYAMLPPIRTNALEILHEGILGALDEFGADNLVDTITGLLRKGDINLVDFHALPERFCSLWERLGSEKSRTLGVSRPRWAVHRRMKFENRPQFLLEEMRSKHRNYIKRKEKELDQTFSNKIHWDWLRDSISVTEACSEMEKVAKMTYQRGLGAGFVNNEEWRKRLSLFSSRKQLMIMLVRANSEPIAFRCNIIYKGTAYASGTGYRPDMAQFRIGTLCLLRTVDYLVRAGVQFLDFGLGDAAYKERFSDLSWNEAGASLFAGSVKGRLLRSYVGSASWFDLRLRSMTARFGLNDMVKRKWRSLVRPVTPS